MANGIFLVQLAMKAIYDSVMNMAIFGRLCKDGSAFVGILLMHFMVRRRKKGCRGCVSGHEGCQARSHSGENGIMSIEEDGRVVAENAMENAVEIRLLLS